MPAITPREPAEYLPLTPLSFEILLSLADDTRHGYGIIKEIEARTGEPLRSSTGTLYLAIHRLQKDGLIRVVGGTGSGSRGKSYELSPVGRRVAAAEAERLAGLVGDARRKELLGDASAAAALEPRPGSR